MKSYLFSWRAKFIDFELITISNQVIELNRNIRVYLVWNF